MENELSRQLQVLVSTMNQKDKSIINRMNIQCPAVIINQSNRVIDTHSELLENDILWIESSKHGLSRSRNDAIASSCCMYCLLADDDEELCDNCEETIIKAFKNNPKADIIVFQVIGIERKFKKYSNKRKRLNFYTAMKTSSVQIAFKRDSILKKGILFDERFGAGEKYRMGEENIFLSDCLKKKLKILYIPEKIAYLHFGQSTWDTGFDDNYFISRGAQYWRMNGVLYPLLICYFCFHIYQKHLGEFDLFKAIKLMFNGAKKCRQESKLQKI